MRKLDEIVREYYIEELGMSQLDNRYPRFLQLAISGLKDLSQDLRNIVSEVTLSVNDNDTVDLPSNYIDYLVIATVYQGQLSTLGLNDNIAPKTMDACGNLEVSSSEISPYEGVFVGLSTNYNKNGENIGGAFGIGGGGNANGTYKIYKQQGYIALNGFVGDEIVLKYLATTEQVDGNFVVEEYLVEAIKAFIAWRSKKGLRSYDLGDKQMSQQFYQQQKKLAQRRVNRFSIAEFVDEYRSGYRSSPGI